MVLGKKLFEKILDWIVFILGLKILYYLFYWCFWLLNEVKWNLVCCLCILGGIVVFKIFLIRSFIRIVIVLVKIWK